MAPLKMLNISKLGKLNIDNGISVNMRHESIYNASKFVNSDTQFGIDSIHNSSSISNTSNVVKLHIDDGICGNPFDINDKYFISLNPPKSDGRNDISDVRGVSDVSWNFKYSNNFHADIPLSIDKIIASLHSNAFI